MHILNQHILRVGNKTGDEQSDLFQCTDPKFIDMHKNVSAELNSNEIMVLERMKTIDILKLILRKKILWHWKNTFTRFLICTKS